MEAKEVVLPKIHDPASLYDKEIRDRKITLRTPPMAPKDKLFDLRKEPEWLLPELRSWMSIPEEQRADRITAIIKGNLEAPHKEKLLRYVMYLEKSRVNLITIVNFIAPKA